MILLQNQGNYAKNWEWNFPLAFFIYFKTKKYCHVSYLQKKLGKFILKMGNCYQNDKLG